MTKKPKLRSMRERIREALKNRVIVRPESYVTIGDGDGEPVEVRFTRSYWSEAKWDAKGRCWYGSGRGKRKGRLKRRPGWDFGTPTGDLIIPPWAQECTQAAAKRKLVARKP